MTTRSDEVLANLEGLRALARSLVHGDAEADDLLQDAAVATLEHPPREAGPVLPWLATVIRNRWRMDRRAESRRRARELAAEAPEIADEIDPIDRARTLERLSSALVALDEPFRTTVVLRYLDGLTAAAIARDLGVPAGTVRWRLKTGLERLRAALDATTPRWKRLLLPIPLKGAFLMKLKATTVAVILLVLLLAGGIVWYVGDRAAPKTAPVATRTIIKPPQPRAPLDPKIAHPEPNPGQGRAVIEKIAGLAVSGRVINWSSGDGVAGAELTFASDEGAAITVRTHDDGAFELAPPAPGAYTLAAIAAPGFLPYAPEYLHSTVHVVATRGSAVRGITVFLFPALDYIGRVVDGKDAPIAGAKIRLTGTPTGEQTIDRLPIEWVSDRDGFFTFHAADDAVLEASSGNRRGWGLLDGRVAITKHMVIKIGEARARDATITGHVVDGANNPVPDVLVRAMPAGQRDPEAPRATAFATTAADGAFKLEGLDRDAYDLATEADGHAPLTKRGVTGDSRGVTLVLEAGELLAGTVVTSEGAPVPSFTLLVVRAEGVARELVSAKSIVDANGHFETRVAHGAYELTATATGWAPSASLPATSGSIDLKLTVASGATLTGVVSSSTDGTPIPYARVMREGRGGGASAQPANAGTVTRSDGTFELTGIPAGPVAISIAADSFHPRIEGGLNATDGAKLGPLALALTPLAPGEMPTTDLVGIGVKLVADGDALRVDMVVPDSGAATANIVVGDHITAVDGTPVTDLGVDGAVAHIRGVVGTTVAITLRRGDGTTTILTVERRKLRA